MTFYISDDATEQEITDIVAELRPPRPRTPTACGIAYDAETMPLNELATWLAYRSATDTTSDLYRAAYATWTRRALNNGGK
jgi:hypothetical protein